MQRYKQVDIDSLTLFMWLSRLSWKGISVNRIKLSLPAFGTINALQLAY